MTELVTRFLIEFKSLVDKFGVHIIPRASYQETIVKLGLTRKTVEAVLLNLTPKHYEMGPMPDKDRPGTGDLYVFSTIIDEIEIYIKLKIDVTNSGMKIAKCISFHEAEYSFNANK